MQDVVKSITSESLKHAKEMTPYKINTWGSNTSKVLITMGATSAIIGSVLTLCEIIKGINDRTTLKIQYEHEEKMLKMQYEHEEKIEEINANILTIAEESKHEKDN